MRKLSDSAHILSKALRTGNEAGYKKLQSSIKGARLSCVARPEFAEPSSFTRRQPNIEEGLLLQR